MSIYGRTPGYMLPAEAVMPAGQVVKIQPVAVSAANAYCAAQNPRMVPTNVKPAGQAAAPSSGISAWTVIAVLAGGFVLYEIGSYYLGKAKEDIHRGHRAHYRY